MKKFYFALIILTSLLFTSFLSFFQDDTNETIIDSIINQVEENIKKRELSIAQNLIDNLEIDSDIKVDDELKIGFWQAKIYIENGQDEKALNKLLEGFTLLQNNQNSKFYFKYSQELGRIFGRVKNYSNSFKYFNLALENALERKDSLAISEANFNLGSAYQMKNQLDSAGIYYKRVIEEYPKLTKNKNVLATTYSNAIGLAVVKNDFELAEEYGKKSFEIRNEEKDTLKMAGLLTNLGGISMYNNDLDKSNEYSYRALELLKNRNDIKSRDIKAITLDNISQVFYLKEDYQQAYDLLFESATISNKIITDNLHSKVTEIEAKYNVAKESELTKIEENKRQRVEFLLYISGIGLITLLGFLWFKNRDDKFKRLNLKLAHNQEKIEAERKLEKIQNDTQIKILNATLDAKESERKYIAEILHDSVSTLLSSANMHLYALKSEIEGDKFDEINKTENIISEAADKIRNLSHKLISSVLLKFGLTAAVEDLCDKYSTSQLKFESTSKNLKRYSQNFEIKTHNIIEELVNNILKHSNATKASIDMEEVGENLQIRISDNGKGFIKEDIIKKDGLGLNQIDARIKVMNGVFKIDSIKDEGTLIYISIPFI